MREGPAPGSGRFVAAAVILVGAFWIAACQPPPAKPAPIRVRLTTGTRGAGFYRLGHALEREYRRVLPNVEFEVIESEGGANNIEAIQAGDADIGLAHANVTYLAFVGRSSSNPVPLTRLRGIAKLNQMAVHVLVPAGSRIRRIEDLRGCRLGLGVGRGSASTASLVLNAFGLRLEDVRVVPVRVRRRAGTPRRREPGRAPGDRERPARRRARGDPGGRAARSRSRGSRSSRLHRAYPFFRRALIPGGTYPGHPDAVHTIGVDSLLVCRADLDEALVHDLTRALFEVLPRLSPLEVSFGVMDVDQAPATPIPLHDGAAR